MCEQLAAAEAVTICICAYCWLESLSARHACILSAATTSINSQAAAASMDNTSSFLCKSICMVHSALIHTLRNDVHSACKAAHLYVGGSCLAPTIRTHAQIKWALPTQNLQVIKDATDPDVEPIYRACVDASIACMH